MRTLIAVMHIYSPNYMFYHDSKKWSYIGFGEEITQCVDWSSFYASYLELFYIKDTSMFSQISRANIGSVRGYVCL